MTKELIFKKFDGTLIEDIKKYVENWCNENPYGEIIIGCDSQEHRRYVKYAIVIVMHFIDQYKIGHGSHIIKSIIFEKKPIKNYRERNGNKQLDISYIQEKLWKEVEYVIKAANMIKECNRKIKIHIDYNSKEGEVSHSLYSTGIGYAQEMGYEAIGKPYSWASTYVADSLCR